MNFKKCTTCKIEKSVSCFFKNNSTKDGYRPDCKDCRKIYSTKNKDKIKKQKDKYYTENSEKVITSTKEYYLLNKKKCAETKKKWYEKNPQRYLDKQKERQAYKRKTDAAFRINASMSVSIRNQLKINNTSKLGKSWKNIVDYSIQDLRENLESKFTKGMTWENYGKKGWHIDHIIPKSSFKYTAHTDEEFKKCWALSNLQPLWATTEIAISYGEGPDYIGNLEKGHSIL